jgi:hypothetical protein
MDNKHKPIKEKLQKVTTHWLTTTTKKEEYYVNEDNKIEGLYTMWNIDGEFCRKINYKNGVLDGKSTIYGSLGVIRSETEYKNGNVHGVLTKYYAQRGYESIEYNEGKLVRVISFRDNKDRECVLPEGDVEAWKACKHHDNIVDGIIYHTINVYVKLRIPAEAKRVTPHDKQWKFKSRCEYAKVLDIVDREGKHYKEAQSFVCNNVTPLVYTVGHVVHPSKYDPDPEEDCSFGINCHRYQDQCDQWFNDS